MDRYREDPLGKIKSILPVKKLHDLDMFSEMDKPELRDYKKAINYDVLQMKGFGSGVIHPSVMETIKKVYDADDKKATSSVRHKR